MTLKLDKRIKALSDILTCFDMEKAKQFIGQIGYFADDLYRFDDLRYCDYGTLTDVRPDAPGGVFHRRDADSYQWFFIPESILKPREKERKYRPFTLNEFLAKFPLMSLVTYREKKNSNCYTVCVIGHGCSRKGKGTVNLGGFFYDLDNLFICYELQDKDGNWTPFGVEDK